MTGSGPSFEIDARLGGGGMAEVHLARMNGDGRAEWVALKRIRAEMSQDKDHVRQFEHEARICSLLDHENIVSLRAFGRDNDGPYLALEYVEGPSGAQLLRAFKEREEGVPQEAALSIARDTARGLAYAHRLKTGQAIRGVIHRDISPENVLIAPTGLAKLADFGIAKVVGATSFTRTNEVKGKFAYMAPELFDGHDADVETDLFAFGAMVYCLIAGVAPFQGRTEAELVRAVLTTVPPRLSSLRPGVPAPVDAWIAKSLSKSRAERPTVAEFIAMTDPLLGKNADAGRRLVAQCVRQAFPDGPLAVAPTTISRATRIARRSTPPAWRTPLLLSLLALPVAALGAYLAWIRHSPAPPPPPIIAPAPTAAAAPPVVTAAPTLAQPPELRHAASKVSSSQGSVWIKAQPWAHVFFDGEDKGVTPIEPFAAKPGTHRLILVNEDLNARRTYSIDVKPGRRTELKYALDSEP